MTTTLAHTPPAPAPEAECANDPTAPDPARAVVLKNAYAVAQSAPPEPLIGDLATPLAYPLAALGPLAPVVRAVEGRALAPVPMIANSALATAAQAVLRPSVLAALTIKDRFPDDDNLTVAALTAALAAQNAKIRDGDMARPEAMLIAQAHTLDTLFAEMVGRSRANSREGFMHSADRYMRLALKAQGQCRTTLQPLSDIKNPRPYIQNNQAQYQQVNNATPPQAAPRAGKPFSSNELLDPLRKWPHRGDSRGESSVIQ
jgi:hypothetical protein